MATVTIHDQIDRLITSSPAFGDGLRGILNQLVATAVSAPQRQRARQIQRDLETYVVDLDGLKTELQSLSLQSRKEFDTLKSINSTLMKRVVSLENDIKEWQHEYEPDSDPARPTFFSNARHAFRVLFRAS